MIISFLWPHLIFAYCALSGHIIIIISFHILFKYMCLWCKAPGCFEYCHYCYVYCHEKRWHCRWKCADLRFHKFAEIHKWSVCVCVCAVLFRLELVALLFLHGTRQFEHSHSNPFVCLTHIANAHTRTHLLEYTRHNLRLTRPESKQAPEVNRV